ncbi:MAG: sulfatase-like hydrolase/transferase [Verrucomicrobiota bacterium]
MKRSIGLLLACFASSAMAQTTLFEDNFNRSNSRNLDASLTGITDGTGSSLSADGVYNNGFLDPNNADPTNGAPDTDPGNGGGAQILSNELELADINGTSNAYINHNVINAEILAAGEFTVSVDVVGFNQSTNGQGGAFAIGMTTAEAAGTTDAMNGASKMTDGFGANSNPAVGDFWLVLRGNSTLKWGSKGNDNGTTEVSVAAKTGTISATFTLADFSDGSTVSYEVFYNGSSQGTGTFTWTDSAQNYIGLDARDNQGVMFDNLSITVPDSGAAAALTSTPTNVSSIDSAASVTLDWLVTDAPSGATYEILDGDNLTVDSGSAAAGSGSVNTTVDGTAGAETFILNLLSGKSVIASDTATVEVVAPTATLDANPVSVPASPGQSVTLDWTAENINSVVTYRITADKPVTYPNANNTGSATSGNGSVEVTVDGTLGEVSFLLEILNGIDVVATANATVTGQRPNVIVIMTDDMGWSDFGCYGSEIQTPTIDALAANGLKYRNFYNTARCSTTRCALLSGLYTQQVASNPGASLPNLLETNNVTIAELLSTTGYRRYMVGKWHLGTSADRSPIGRGFQHIFGQTSGGSAPHNQVSGGNHGSFWNTNNFGYYSENNEIAEIDYATEYPGVQFHQTTFIGEYALRFLDHHIAEDDGAPFFLYMPFNAVHWDINAPNVMADRYTDVADLSPDGLTANGGLDGGDYYQYEVGWDQVRTDRYAKQLAVGARDNTFTLAPLSPSINSTGTSGNNVITPPWISVDGGDDRRDDLARRMALYAAMLEQVDDNIKKVVDKLTVEGLLDNTIIFVLADNGGNYEGGLYGKTSGTSNAAPVTGTTALRNLGQPGNPDLHIGGGWANANNTPFRLYKHFSHEGGIRTPCIVHYPNGITSPGRWIDDRGHLIDIMATIVDVTNTPYPSTFTDLDENNTGNNSVRNLLPLEGESLVPHFDPTTVANFPNRPLGFEHEVNRAWIKNDIKLVTKNFEYIDGSSPADELELYDLTTDPTELNNLATTNTALLSEYIDEWNAWASRVGVPSGRLLDGISPTVTLNASLSNIPANAVTPVSLDWNASFIPAGATYEITASPANAVSFPSGGATGNVAEGADSGTVSINVDGGFGDVDLTVEIFDSGSSLLTSDTASVVVLAPDVDPAALPNDLFVDTFNRPDNGNHDTVLTGMFGSVVSSLSADAAYIDSFEGGSTEISGNKLGMAVGSGMTETSILHNFIDPEILTDRGFSVQVRVDEIDSTAGNDEPNRFGGFGVGLTLAEAQSSADVGSTSAPFSFRGRTNNANGTADFFIDLALDGNIRCWSNGTVLDTISVGKTSGNLLVCFECTSFASGSTVTVTAFHDGELVDLDSGTAATTRTFTWDNSDSNYIGLSSRASNSVTLENLAIRTLPLSSSLANNYATAAGLSGADSALDEDPDGDGDDNFKEWLKNGAPNAPDVSTRLLSMAPSANGEFRFNYTTLVDAQKAGLTYAERSGPRRFSALHRRARPRPRSPDPRRPGRPGALCG